MDKFGSGEPNMVGTKSAEEVEIGTDREEIGDNISIHGDGVQLMIIGINDIERRVYLFCIMYCF